jgi:hypothetical protein
MEVGRFVCPMRSFTLEQDRARLYYLRAQTAAPPPVLSQDLRALPPQTYSSLLQHLYKFFAVSDLAKKVCAMSSAAGFQSLIPQEPSMAYDMTDVQQHFSGVTIDSRPWSEDADKVSMRP